MQSLWPFSAATLTPVSARSVTWTLSYNRDRHANRVLYLITVGSSNGCDRFRWPRLGVAFGGIFVTAAAAGRNPKNTLAWLMILFIAGNLISALSRITQ